MEKLKEMATSGMLKDFLTEKEVRDLFKEETPKNEDITIAADNLSITKEP